jgi:PAS domain S-box-containing protein
MRILVVDDHELVRRGICSVLAGKPELQVCAEASDGRDAVDKAKSLHPDVIVMDISMPNMNGLEATREIKRILPETAVLMVSQHQSPEMVRQAFNAGARGYVVKSAISKDLLIGIDRVRRNQSFVSSETLGDSRNLDSQEILQRSVAFEQALHDSEERFRSAMNNMAEGLYTIDQDGRVTFVNPAAEKMFGWTASELQGKRMHDVTHYKHPDGRPFPAEECAGFRVLRSGIEARDQDDVFIRKDGTFFPVVYSASPLRQGGKNSGLVICFRDDTKRREAEDALRRSEHIYRTIGESIDYGIWICDAEGRNTYASPSLLRLVGSTQEQFSSMGWQHAVHPEDRDPTMTAWRDCVRRGCPWEHEVRFRAAEGGWRHVLMRGGPVRDAAGNVIHWAGIALDVQHRKESEAALGARISERTEALQKATEELRRLSGTLLQTQDEERRRIARELHDGVGQLLAAVSMNISGVQLDQARLSAAGREALDQTVHLIEQASQEIRTMSHLLHPPLLDEVGLESALQWYINGFAERSKINVTMQTTEGFSDGLPRDLALALFRIIQECLTNVHRHSESRTVQVEIERSAHEISVEVRDQGKGIPQEMQSRISSGLGVGVGLRGMQERTRQFQGHMEVFSSPGDTRIRAILPIEQETTHALAAPATNGTHDGATILCVDDEESALLTRRLLLESVGHRVLEARSGPEGLELFRSQKIDLVVLDYWMSGMKGTSVAAEMKQIHPSVPIIMLSGVSDLPGEGSGWVDQWMIKGTHRAEHLLESINTLLERKLV